MHKILLQTKIKQRSKSVDEFRSSRGFAPAIANQNKHLCCKKVSRQGLSFCKNSKLVRYDLQFFCNAPATHGQVCPKDKNLMI